MPTGGCVRLGVRGLGQMSFHMLVTRNPLERAVGDRTMENSFSYDLGPGLSMRPRVSTTHNNLDKLVFHVLIARRPLERAVGNRTMETRLAMILDLV